MARLCSLHAGAVGGPLLDVIEGALGRLLEQSLEDSTFQALQSNLEPAAAGAGSSAPSQAAIRIAGFGGSMLGGGAASSGGAAAAAAAVAEARALGAAAERCSLLSILILIYYHPRKQCTPDRFLSLAKLFHATLLARGAPRAPAAAPTAAGPEGEPSPAQLSVKLVSWVGEARGGALSTLHRWRGAAAMQLARGATAGGCWEYAGWCDCVPACCPHRAPPPPPGRPPCCCWRCSTWTRRWRRWQQGSPWMRHRTSLPAPRSSGGSTLSWPAGGPPPPPPTPRCCWPGPPCCA